MVKILLALVLSASLHAGNFYTPQDGKHIPFMKGQSVLFLRPWGGVKAGKVGVILTDIVIINADADPPKHQDMRIQVGRKIVTIDSCVAFMFFEIK